MFETHLEQERERKRWRKKEHEKEKENERQENSEEVHTDLIESGMKDQKGINLFYIQQFMWFLNLANQESCLLCTVKALHTMKLLTENLLEGRTIHISLSDVPAKIFCKFNQNLLLMKIGMKDFLMPLKRRRSLGDHLSTLSDVTV